jgi:hypothetical protein
MRGLPYSLSAPLKRHDLIALKMFDLKMPVPDAASARVNDVILLMYSITVAEPMIRNVAPAMVTEVFRPTQGAGWQGLRKQQRQRELDNCNKKVVRARSAATAPSLDWGQKGSHIAPGTFDASLRSWVTPLPPNLYRDRATNV